MKLQDETLVLLLTGANPHHFFDEVNKLVREKFPNATRYERKKISDMVKGFGMQFRNVSRSTFGQAYAKALKVNQE